MNCLMIDDNISKILSMRNILDKSNDTLDFHLNLTSGLEALSDYLNSTNSKPFDLLILDMNFPIEAAKPPIKNCGIMMLEQLSSRKINIPTILYSSDEVKLSQEDLSRLGVIAVIDSKDKDISSKIAVVKDKIECEIER